MATLKKIGEHPDLAATPEPPPLTPLEAKRRRLAAALKAAEGLWKDRTDMPKDGVQYQEQLRSEWH
ncbi:hypothetical protein [Duganella sp. BuS-21]|uniref:hypothetical protein n=1 Tax=Duganella sp. BuS-21 TaxID=2943848 RepID=UPI0035A580B8